MLVRLTASDPDRPRDGHTVGSVVVSVAFHGVVIWAAVATAHEVAAAPTIERDPGIIYVPPAIRRDDGRHPEVAGPAFVLPADAFARRLEVSFVIPDGIPPVDDGPFDPRTFSRGEADVPGLPGSGDGPSVGTVYAAHVVDEPPIRLAGPPVRYPPTLRAAGLEGRAVVEVVIDSLGRPEPATLEVVETSHPGFAGEAIQVVSGSVYRPGRVGGRPVRVRIRQPVVFRIGS